MRHRQAQLAVALHLKTVRTPCLNTYRTLLGKIIDGSEFEQLLHGYFAAQPEEGHSMQIALDGKTLRGTIPAGQTKGAHLLADYAPQEGWVLIEVAGEGKENEIPAAPRVLQCLVFTAMNSSPEKWSRTMPC